MTLVHFYSCFLSQPYYKLQNMLTALTKWFLGVAVVQNCCSSWIVVLLENMVVGHMVAIPILRMQRIV